MASASLLLKTPLYKMTGTNNWMTSQLVAVDDESFMIIGGRGERKVFRDVELKPDKNGKYIIDIKYLDLKFFYPKVDLPTEFELPTEILKVRAEKRRLNALAKNTLFIDRSVDPIQYFYLEGDMLRVMQGEKEVTIDKIEIIYNQKAAKADALELGYPFLMLPAEVAGPFEKVLREKELKSLSLVIRGKSVLDGRDYYGFNIEVPPEKWDLVKELFEFFEGDDDLTGWLTCYPTEVAEILRIPIDRL
jgi:hypothetical protein